MDIFGSKAQQLLTQAQELLIQAQGEMANNISELQQKQGTTEQRLAQLEQKHDVAANKINELQQSLDDIRDSAIRGEVASGRKSKDVAAKFGLTPARVTQIAPRRRYNNG